MMSLTKKQFEKLVGIVIEKIQITPGVEDYIRDYSRVFSLEDSYGKVGVYYKSINGMVDLLWLAAANNECMLSSFDRCQFLDALLPSLKELIERSNDHRADFVTYLEQIKGL